jgi:hypothetical protein
VVAGEGQERSSVIGSFPLPTLLCRLRSLFACDAFFDALKMAYEAMLRRTISYFGQLIAR